MREVILPVNPAPLISGQTSYTYPLMLLPGGEEAERCFIANSYINCYYDKTYFDIYEQDYYFQNNGLFERRAEYADNRRIESETHSVLMYFYRQICKGYAITGHWNEELVDGATGSSDEECLIHGVDPDDGKLYVISISGASPRSYVVSAETFFKARCTGPEGYIWYVFIKPLKNTVSVIDKEKILFDYRDFICSANRKNVFDDGRSYGIGYIDAYKRYVDSCIKSEERLDALNKALIHDVLREHPKYGMIREMTEYCGLYDIYRLQHILSLKYTVKSDKDIIWTIKSHLKDAFKRECVVLEKLLECWGEY